MSTNKFTRKHYYYSPKAIGVVHLDSSYELRLVVMLDADQDVISYKDHQFFVSENGQKRVYDFLVNYKDGITKLIEVKPLSRLEQFREQIEDNKKYAQSNGYVFEIWTEQELGFTDSKKITAWADRYLLENHNVDYAKARKERSSARVKKHYHKNIATDKVEFYCEYCKETHSALRLTYNKNIERNGRYICEKEGGHISGSKPKPHLRKENPHASDGKKQCSKCNEIKPFFEFSPDKSRRDGFCSMCKPCRSAKMKAAYDANNKK